MSVTGYLGIVAAFCTTVAFVPQIVKLRKQGGKDLSYPTLFLYMVGVLLWLVYGIQVHAAAVVWANALTGVLVLLSIVLKANPPAKKLDTGARRLRIAVDMDEVIADAFSNQPISGLIYQGSDPYDPTAGELRTHYAGFFDPGFGYAPDGAGHGSRAALEVRARDVSFMVEHRQPVCKLAFERMAAEPEVLYGEQLGSNYQGQQTMLSKHFASAAPAAA